jgi:hypothetical protein
VRDLEITFVIFSLTPAHSTNNPWSPEWGRHS